MTGSRLLPLLLLAACGAKAAPAPVVVATAPTTPIAAPEAPKPVTPKPIVAPAAPAKQPLDPHVKVDSALLLAASDTEVWMTLDDTHTVVVDRATHCAVESYVESPRLVELVKASSDEAVEAAFKNPETLAAIRDVVGMGLRFGARERAYRNIAWTPDGHHIFFELRDLVWHSADGGQSFSLFDENFGSRLEVSPDGKSLVYERAVKKGGPSCSRKWEAGCNTNRNWTVTAVDSLSPRTVTSQFSAFVDFDASSHARFTRSDKTQACAETFDLASATKTSTACVPIPAKATGSWASQSFESISPNGRFGVVKWEEGRPNLVGATALTYVVSLVDLQTSTLLKTFTDVRAMVSDAGDMVMQSAAEGSGDHLFWVAKDDKKKRPLGSGVLLDFDGREVIVGTYRPGTLGTRKCDLLKLVKKPS